MKIQRQVTFKQNYVGVDPLRNAMIVPEQVGDWFKDYNENHPYLGLKIRWLSEFRSAQFITV
jgi:hypothetical protein